MGIIKVLPQVLINQIAAGEVIERPASVVKELVENSVDAGSQNILIEAENGGMEFIKIVDDGCGMAFEDARLAFHRYATSKISELDDLQDIHSFGFRGEALSALASVSSVTLIAKQKGALSGCKTEYREGKEIGFETIGCPEGTSVEVRKLFSFVPARRKFMKSDSSEFSHIAGIITEMALFYRDISFKFIHNGKVILDLPKTDDELSRIRDLLGRDIADELIPVEIDLGGTKINGFIGKPAIAQSRKKHQYFFVNGRAVSDLMASRACFDAYESLLFSRTYPVFVLKLFVPSESVDVNVHPRKREVRFHKPHDIYKLIFEACRMSLENYVLFPKIKAGEGDVNADGNYEHLMKSSFLREEAGRGAGGRSTEERGEPIKRPEGLRMDLSQDLTVQPIAQIANSYIVALNEEGLWIVDQHAAHERVMYENFKKLFNSEEVISQPLLTPIRFEFSAQEISLLKIHQVFLEKLGFKFEPFGGNSFLLSAVPAMFFDKDIKRILLQAFDELEKSASEKSVSESEKMLRSLACRAAVKFGQALTLIEQEALLKQFFNLKQRSTCPHGRPTMVELTFSELDRKFRRG